MIALDKSANKIRQIEENAARLGLANVCAFVQDATTCLGLDEAKDGNSRLLLSPPFPRESFAKILIDAPCSALGRSNEVTAQFTETVQGYATLLMWIPKMTQNVFSGQRPQFHNAMSSGELASFPKLQKQILATAVDLLRPGGDLVYSTCTFVAEENENMVEWALERFPDTLELSQVCPAEMGQPGLETTTLPASQRCKVQRFFRVPPGDDPQSDTIGFFVAKFRKK